jgi:sigma-B regulation protein RsbU (phosphoserine phosphatase)
MFITVFYGVLDTRTGGFDYCCAGHNPPYLVSKDGVRPLESVGGLVIGAVAEWEYQGAHVDLQPGDVLFQYTDGVTEATGHGDSDFGEKALEDCLAGVGGHTAREIVDRVVATVQEFSSGLQQSDDITCLAVRYAGK